MELKPGWNKQYILHSLFSSIILVTVRPSCLHHTFISDIHIAGLFGYMINSLQDLCFEQHNL